MSFKALSKLLTAIGKKSVFWTGEARWNANGYHCCGYEDPLQHPEMSKWQHIGCYLALHRENCGQRSYQCGNWWGKTA